MAKFRKRPVVIEAWLFRATDNATHSDPELGCGVVNFSEPASDSTSFVDGKHWIATLEGPHIVNDGDYVIRGVKGEYYPCKPDIFAATYEPAESVVAG